MRWRAIYNRAIEWDKFTGENPVLKVKRYEIALRLVDFHSAEEKDRLLAVVTKANPTIEQRNLERAVLLMGWASKERDVFLAVGMVRFRYERYPRVRGSELLLESEIATV